MQTAPVILLNLGCAIIAIGTLVGLINPKKSPHKAISGMYYTAISSLFVPRFVKNSVWSISDADVEWKCINHTPFQNSKAASLADSQVSSCSSDVRSFRIPSSSFKRRKSTKRQDGTMRSFASENSDGGHRSYRKYLRQKPDLKKPVYAHSDPPSGVCTPVSSPMKRGKSGIGHIHWEPKMSRITSGKELESLSLAEETVAMKLGALPERGDQVTIDRIQESPLSPAGSIDSATSFSRSVSEYVDSWLQSLKSGIGAPGASDVSNLEDSQNPVRKSLDGHGAHRHYVRGSVAATNESLLPILEKYAVESQVYAKSKAAEIASQTYPGHSMEEASAIDSIGLDGDCPDSIRRIVTDEHLLQFGDLIGETPCTDMLKELSIEEACDSPNSLFGLQESPSSHWEHSASGTTEGIDMNVQRRILRNNYYMYKTDVNIRGLDPQDIRPFHLDDQARSLWDDSAIVCKREMPPGESRISKHAESCLQRYVSRFPRPLSARRYEYARRVWTRPSDGGCYAIAKACSLPPDDSLPSKYVLVKEYVSACLIRRTSSGTQIVTIYFENSQVRPGLAKMAVPKGLWPFWTKYEASLRFFAKAKHVNTSNRKSLDESSLVLERRGEGIDPSDTKNQDSTSEYDSDDEIYDTLARIKADKKSMHPPSSAGDLPRWIRRVLVAGAIKLVHESMRK